MAQAQSFSFYIGEDIALDFTEADYTVTPAVATNIAGWTITLTIRTGISSKVTVTPATITNAAAGQFSFALPHATTVLLPAGAHTYDVQRVDAGFAAVLAIGTVTINRDVLNASLI